MKYKTMFILLSLAVACPLRAQFYYYEDDGFTLERQQLSREARTAVGFRKLDIERRIKEIDAQQLKVEKMRSEGRARSATRVNSTFNYSPSYNVNNVAGNWNESRRDIAEVLIDTNNASASDWKQQESSEVLVKGTMKSGNSWVAIVNLGQIVSENDVISTRFEGQEVRWRVKRIGSDGAEFEKIPSTGDN